MAFKMTKPTFGKSPLKQGELEKMDQPKVKEAGMMGASGSLPTFGAEALGEYGVFQPVASVVKGQKKAAKATDKSLKKEAKKQSKTKATRNWPTGSKL